MKKLGYLRVSTKDQKPDRQIEGLKGLCDELFIEKLSATARRRPIYEAVLRQLKAGDVLVIADLDRAYRSTMDMLRAIEIFRKRQIRLFLAKTGFVDIYSPTGKFHLTLLAALAELEVDTTRLRTQEGVAAARRKGKRLGRPAKLSAADLREARRAIRDRSGTFASLAREYDVTPWTLSRALKRETVQRNVS